MNTPFVLSPQVFYLMAEKGAVDAGTAALTVSGELLAGYHCLLDCLPACLPAARSPPCLVGVLGAADCQTLLGNTLAAVDNPLLSTHTTQRTKNTIPPPGLELGGLAGSTVAGLLSDRAIRAAAARGSQGGNVGHRIKVVMAYTVGMAGMLAALQAVPASATGLQWLVIAGLGFTIYGPQMLIGLSGAELVAPSAVGASQGILGWIAYLGAANAGIPLSYVVQNAGWGGFFTALLGACAAALVLLSTVANAPSYLQRKEREERGGGGAAGAKPALA